MNITQRRFFLLVWAPAFHMACCDNVHDETCENAVFLQTGVHTDKDTIGDKCKSWCDGGSNQWATRCKWKNCAGCKQCQIMTTITTTPAVPYITKMGLVCAQTGAHYGRSFCNSTHLGKFTDKSILHNTDGAKWFYNYAPRVYGDVLDWLNANNVEYVPMVGWRHLWRGNAPNDKKCYITNRALDHADAPGQAGKGPACADTPDGIRDFLVSQLNDTINSLTVRPQYFMGFNEPEDAHYVDKNISTKAAVYYWRNYLQPAAEQLGLKMVSPTQNIFAKSGGFCKAHDYGCKYEGSYLAHFLMECWDNRDATPPCSVDKIKAASVHGYECFQGTWEDLFAPSTGKWFRDLKAQMKGYGGKDWTNFIDNLKVWVTEFNCNNDNVGSNKLGGMLLANMTESCARISGYMDASGYPVKNKWGKSYSWGEGVVRTLEELPIIQRWSWWNTWNSGRGDGVKPLRKLSARLVDDAGNLFPTGWAIAQGTDNKDCEPAGGVEIPVS